MTYRHSFLLHIVSSLLIGWGSAIAFLGPIGLNWFIHGNYERSLWVINGPYPFSDMGSGPFQLMMHAQLILIGLVLLALGIILEIVLRKRTEQ